MIEKLLETIMQNYERGPQFFINSNKYTQYSTQMTERGVNLGDLVSVSLQCSGHGSFRKQALATRFVSHFAQLLRYNDKIKKIKLKISGFDLSQKLEVMSRRQGDSTLIKLIVNLIEQKISYLTSLQIRINNVTNCSVQDFKSILNLGVNQSAKQLTNLSCEFSDWTFTFLNKENGVDKSIYSKGIKKTDHDRNGQPSLESFLSMLNEGFENTLGSPMQDLKKFRLQISTWYYSDFQMELFFYGTQNNKGIQSMPKSDKVSQRIQYFHKEFKSKVEAMIFNIMPNLTNMQLDLRNWNKMFEMAILKGALMNISNRQRQNSLSQISKRHQKTRVIVKSIVSMVLQQPVKDKKQNQKLKQMSEEQEQEQYFDFNVVV